MPSKMSQLLKDLKTLNRDIIDNAELSEKVNGFITFCKKNEECSFDTFSEKEPLYELEKKELDDKKKKTADIFVIRVQYLNELKAEAEKQPESPWAKKIDDLFDNHKLTDEEIKTLEDFENEYMLKKVEEQEMTSLESKKIKEINKVISEVKLMTKPDGVDYADFQKDTMAEFEEAKKTLTDHLAKALAIKTFGRMISSMAAADDTMTEEEKNQTARDLLTEDNINDSAKEIKTRDDFKRMMSDIKNWDDLGIIAEQAQATGDLLFKRLADTSKTILQEEKQAEQMAKQMHSGKELDNKMVLKPQNQHTMF